MLGQVGSQPGAFSDPTSLAVDSEGNLLVADTGTHRIKKFSPEGEVLAVFGERGSGDGQFSEPVGLAFASPRGVTFDRRGFVYVTEPGNGQVLRFPLSDLPAP